ncbi:MAG TPA: outer membrane protein transport protein [Kofleriaceae bacterium]|jgi:long-chain fatty acid transport protein
MLTRISTSLFLVVTSLGGVASANAFFLNEHDAKSNGRAGASTASDTDASSVIYNPGGIPVADGVQVSVNGTLYVAQGSYEPEGGGAKVKTDSAPQLAPSVFATARVHDMIAVGVGFHAPFGLAVSYPDHHPQAAVIQDQSLRAYEISAAVGINLEKFVPGLTFGGGVDLVPATVHLQKEVDFGDTTGTADLGGNAFGVGGRAGVMYRPAALKMLKIGAMWRSKVNLDFKGGGDFDIAAPYRDQLPPDGDIATSITLPMAFDGGVAVNPIPQLELEIDAMWQQWDKFKTLTIDLPGGVKSVTPENYKNTTTIRIGAEYAITKEAAVRLGFIWDPTPIPSTTQTAQLPDVDRIDLTVGGSYAFGNGLSLHASVLGVLPRTRSTSDELYMPAYKGTFGAEAIVASVALSYAFDPMHRTSAAAQALASNPTSTPLASK